MSRLLRQAQGGIYMFFCPPCRCSHGVPADLGARWKFDGNWDAPTLTPSLVISDGEGVYCHVVVTAGKLHFMSDCRHAMAGQIVDMEPF